MPWAQIHGWLGRRYELVSKNLSGVMIRLKAIGSLRAGRGDLR
jgi:hypothetical protein